jgi:hypothetical protein
LLLEEIVQYLSVFVDEFNSGIGITYFTMLEAWLNTNDITYDAALYMYEKYNAYVIG